MEFWSLCESFGGRCGDFDILNFFECFFIGIYLKN